MVFYRKYRPQTIEELDSASVRDSLFSFLSSKDIAHAFLFTGPKGLGKTSAARIVAKVVNCERKLKVENGKLKIKKKNSQLSTLNSQLQEIEPCNKCHQCVSITNGTNIDVLEIDGASNRGIDEIRDLREKVRLSAARASKKVYIIDEVHMLTTEAFNALLKTLEEPPLHAIFILCTTEPHKLPQTIVSRCMHVSFKKATTDELVRSFGRISEKEKLIIDKDALNFIASLSDGSFRDGSKILEEMAAFNKKITKELVEEKYQIRQLQDKIEKTIEFLSEKDAKKGLQLIAGLVEQGMDMKYFLEQLISDLHQILLVKIGVDGSSKFEVRSSKLSIGEIKELVELLSRVYKELKYAVLPQLPLEMAIVEWGESKRHSGNPDLSGASRISMVQRDFGQARMTGFEKVPRADGFDNFWQELINKVKLQNHSIAAVLRGCILKEHDGRSLIIETKYKFHKERLQDKHVTKLLEKLCKEISGKEASVSVLLKE